MPDPMTDPVDAVERVTRWISGAATSVVWPGTVALTGLRADLEALLAAKEAAERENEELRLAILGGEDAPGYAASLPLETVLGVMAENQQTARRDAELAWDGETATSWKSRAQAAEAKAAALVEAAREAVLQIEYLHGKFAETGSGAAVLARLRSALQAATQDQPAQPSVGEGDE